MRHYFLFSLIILILGASVQAQTDSLQTPAKPLQKTAKLKKSPMGALLRSVAIPGWGQYYNRKYVKSAVVFGAETFFLIEAVHWWRKTEKQYNFVQTDTSGGDQFYQFEVYQSYRTRRDDFLWATGISIFISMFDAYVDAHLSGFDIDLTPNFEDQKPGASLSVTYRF